MKLIIDIDEELYKDIINRNPDVETEFVLDRLVEGVDNGIPLNDKTNGDIIKALFPDCLISEGENYVSFWYTKEEDGRYVNFIKFWWEEPYKEKGIEDRYEPIEEEKYITAEEYMKTGKWIGD